MIRIWQGEQVPQFNYTKAEGIFWESCGCESGREIDVRQHAKENLEYMTHALDDYVREADETMYIEKANKKANRTE